MLKDGLAFLCQVLVNNVTSIFVPPIGFISRFYSNNTATRLTFDPNSLVYVNIMKLLNSNSNLT